MLRTLYNDPGNLLLRPSKRSDRYCLCFAHEHFLSLMGILLPPTAPVQTVLTNFLFAEQLFRNLHRVPNQLS
jgi:hypothetical protein